MTLIKTKEEIEVMREGGMKLNQVLQAVLSEVRPGVTKIYLDKIAESKIEKLGGKPSFKMVPGYHWTTCLSINNEVVHGIPDETELKSGDILGVDIGIFYKGFNTDMAETVEVGKIRKEGDNNPFLEVGRKALQAAIKQVSPGKRVGDISLAIQEEVVKGGCSPVRVLTGHGVGRKLHEEPMIPCFLGKDIKRTPCLEVGMTLAIEVIYNQGTEDVCLAKDDWTIVTKDGRISGLFEKSVAVADGVFLVLTS